LPIRLQAWCVQYQFDSRPLILFHLRHCFYPSSLPCQQSTARSFWEQRFIDTPLLPRDTYPY
jgi:hypothetical protein